MFPKDVSPSVKENFKLKNKVDKDWALIRSLDPHYSEPRNCGLYGREIFITFNPSLTHRTLTGSNTQ